MSIGNILIVLGIVGVIWQLDNLIKLFREAYPKKVVKPGTKVDVDDIPNEMLLEGFGIVLGGQLVLNENRPLIFERYDLAVRYAENRNFGSPNSLVKLGKRVDIIWQKWDVASKTVFIGEVMNGRGYANGTN